MKFFTHKDFINSWRTGHEIADAANAKHDEQIENMQKALELAREYFEYISQEDTFAPYAKQSNSEHLASKWLKKYAGENRHSETALNILLSYVVEKSYHDPQAMNILDRFDSIRTGLSLEQVAFNNSVIRAGKSQLAQHSKKAGK